MKKKIPEEKRPRFGCCMNLDRNPQVIWEERNPDNYANMIKKVYMEKNLIPVVVIPLPFMSAKMRARIEKFVREELP